MSRPAHTNAIGMMFQHLPTLRAYAAQMILREQQLGEKEEQDRALRMNEFRAIGKSLNWTDKEVVALLLREVFSGY